MEYLGAQAIADVHHCSRKNSRAFEKFNDVFPRLRLQQLAHDKFLSFQVWLDLWVFEVNLFFSFQQREPEKSATQKATYTQEVAFFCSASFYKLIRRHFP